MGDCRHSFDNCGCDDQMGSLARPCPGIEFDNETGSFTHVFHCEGCGCSSAPVGVLTEDQRRAVENVRYAMARYTPDKRDADIGAIEEIVATRLATHEIRQLMQERRWLIARVREMEAALREISSKLDCDPPCTMNQVTTQCGSCGHLIYETWCAGCVARRALAHLTEPAEEQ